VLKNGVIVENLDVSKKTHYLFGRGAGCDFLVEHPSLSRRHCVLQYRDNGTLCTTRQQLAYSAPIFVSHLNDYLVSCHVISWCACHHRWYLFI
jgi:hypothetical protein